MRAYRISNDTNGGGAGAEITELDLKHVLKLVRMDLKYLRGRGAARKSRGADANSAKIENRQRLADKLEALQKG